MLPAVSTGRIVPMSTEAMAKVQALDARLGEIGCEKARIGTDHVLHGGMYSRTIRIPAGVMLTGAHIRVPTMIIFNGSASVFTGEKFEELHGYHVLAGSAGRKQAFFAYQDTDLTMIFPTQAQTVEDAEEEFTNEAHMLFSRESGAINNVTITGE